MVWIEAENRLTVLACFFIRATPVIYGDLIPFYYTEIVLASYVKLLQSNTRYSAIA